MRAELHTTSLEECGYSGDGPMALPAPTSQEGPAAASSLPVLTPGSRPAEDCSRHPWVWGTRRGPFVSFLERGDV